MFYVHYMTCVGIKKIKINQHYYVLKKQKIKTIQFSNTFDMSACRNLCNT
jgi:hypothetical protein